jgi:hypothetical protein
MHVWVQQSAEVVKFYQYVVSIGFLRHPVQYSIWHETVKSSNSIEYELNFWVNSGQVDF